MENLFKTNIFDRLHSGEDVTCEICKNGKIKPVSDRRIEDEFCFECDSCGAHYRYDPVVVTVE